MRSVRLLWSLLDGASRKKFLILLFLTTLSGIVEIMSVGLVIPFVALASNSLPFGHANSLTRVLTGFVTALGISEKWNTAALGVIFLMGVALANIYLCAYQYYAAWVVNGQKREFSNRILENLACHPLEWLDQRNSSDLTKIALTDVTLASQLINAVTQVAAVVTRGLVVYLFFLYTQARLALGLAVGLFTLTLYLIVFRFVQRPVIRAGRTAQLTQAQMFRAASELIGGAREVRATSTERAFYQRFERASEKAVHPQVVRTMPTYLTRAGLETATVALVMMVLIYFKAKDGNLSNGLPLLSSYAVAGIRLLPAIQQSLSYFLEIRFYAPSLDEVARLIQDKPARSLPLGDVQPMSLRHQIVLSHVCYGYSPETLVLKDVSLEISRNSRVAFVGETGAGKSTIIDIILALRVPQSGSMAVDGQEITVENSRAWRGGLGYVPQSIYLLDASIAENIAFGIPPDHIQPDRLEEAARAASLHDFILSLPEGYQTFVGERGVRLSGGQCQRIGIARALYHNPEVVIFDEATSSLDSQTENLIIEALELLKGNKTLIVIAHRLNTVWDFDRLFVMDKGQLIDQGTALELLERCGPFQRLAQHQVAQRPLQVLSPQ